MIQLMDFLAFGLASFLRVASRRKLGRPKSAGARKEQTDKPLVVLPYVKGVTERVTRAVNPFARAATRPERTLKSFFSAPQGQEGQASSSTKWYATINETSCSRISAPLKV